MHFGLLRLKLYAIGAIFGLPKLRQWRIYLDMKIVRTKRYLKDLKRIRATEAEAEAVEQMIATNPEAGDVIQGLRGVRKIRFGLRNKGKSGGGRAIYFLMVNDDVAIMITAYMKKEQSDLTTTQRKAILKMLEDLHDD
ncbi:hypothetical protein [Rhodovulum sulfidophilum]|uniref:Addiction module toxin RelE n=1 Tax=Rhodovulum sulfidophilum TaxID=35806 RepID=A0ABS1S1Q5_RHOSU|nr:hypothetical protein [Rhodovulum sulfidophilum]MBL3564308.1 hypothetical protein [Rhodovulum sulfidophilum]MBL3611124.1 hypothetical protein [Rhodovulum sulfidophilum]